MKYDVIIIGAGPAGLMAAKTTAEDGLKVLLIERKKDITNIDRLCCQFASINHSVTGIGADKYGYLEPIRLEVGTYKTRVHFPGPGFFIDYDGPLRPYFKWMYFSPSGYQIKRYNAERFFGFFWQKEALLAGILSSAMKAGAKVLTETLSLGVENITDGVKVRVRRKSGEETIETRRVIAADGSGSSTVQSLESSRSQHLTIKGQGMRAFGYVLEGVQTELRLNSWLQFTIPSLNPTGNIIMYMMPWDSNVVATAERGDISPVDAINMFMKLPFYEPWFRNTRVVGRHALGGRVNGGLMRSPMREPVIGNVLVIAEACRIEATNPGALACGYQGAKATLKELNGQEGYPKYIDWWQKSFEGLNPTYRKAAARFMAFNAVCSDEEVDYIYRVLQGQVGVPSILLGQNLKQIKDERPELYQKLKKTGIDKSLDKQKLDASDVF